MEAASKREAPLPARPGLTRPLNEDHELQPPIHASLCPVSSPRDAHNHTAKPLTMQPCNHATMQPRFTKTPAKTTLQQMQDSTIRLACSLYYMVLSAPISSHLPFSPPSSLPVPPFTQPNACFCKKGIASKMQKKARTKMLTKENGIGEQGKMRTSNKCDITK